MARILKETLQQIADCVLSEFQCGFTKGRGCVDMDLGSKQPTEKVREHKNMLYILLVDLKNAYM